MWADQHIERLKNGHTVVFRPRGRSMAGRVEDGQLVTVDPTEEPGQGDVVLCTVKGHQYLHLVKDVSTRRSFRGEGTKTRYQIGSNTGKINGWVGRAQIHGVMTSVEW